jgi:hypothetical protein
MRVVQFFKGQQGSKNRDSASERRREYECRYSIVILLNMEIGFRMHLEICDGDAGDVGRKNVRDGGRSRKKGRRVQKGGRKKGG